MRVMAGRRRTTLEGVGFSYGPLEMDDGAGDLGDVVDEDTISATI